MGHVVGLSFGKDSVCMALALKLFEPRPYNYVYTPTGDELPEMIEHIARIESLLGQSVISLTNGTLESVIEQNRMLPSFHARFCTRILKLKPYGAFMKTIAPAVSYIGLRDDEEEREGVRPGGDFDASDVTQDFPFRRWEWGIDEVWGFLRGFGINIPERTDCARCPYQTIGEWYNLWKYHPEIFAHAEMQELIYGQTFRSPTGNHGTWSAGLREMRLEFEKGRVPERSLRMMEKRRGMCSRCSM